MLEIWRSASSFTAVFDRLDEVKALKVPKDLHSISDTNVLNAEAVLFNTEIQQQQQQQQVTAEEKKTPGLK